jgi:hypothetical protein
VKVCGHGCQKDGCSMNAARKNDLYEQFRSVPADVQSAILMGCLEQIPPATRSSNTTTRTCSYKYNILNAQGYRKEVCKKTLMDVFAVSQKRLQILKEKLKTGILAPVDGRGRHTTRPHTVPLRLHNEIEAHINSYPSEISHYSRAVRNVWFLFKII